MFWKNKKKKYSEGTNALVTDKKPQITWGYIEILPLTQRLSCLDQMVRFIDEINITHDCNNAGLMNYQMSLKQAYIAEFEKEYQSLFCKTMCYTDFKKTRSGC